MIKRTLVLSVLIFLLEVNVLGVDQTKQEFIPDVTVLFYDGTALELSNFEFIRSSSSIFITRDYLYTWEYFREEEDGLWEHISFEDIKRIDFREKYPNIKFQRVEITLSDGKTIVRLLPGMGYVTWIGGITCYYVGKDIISGTKNFEIYSSSVTKIVRSEDEHDLYIITDKNKEIFKIKDLLFKFLRNPPKDDKIVSRIQDKVEIHIEKGKTSVDISEIKAMQHVKVPNPITIKDYNKYRIEMKNGDIIVGALIYYIYGKTQLGRIWYAEPNDFRGGVEKIEFK